MYSWSFIISISICFFYFLQVLILLFFLFKLRQLKSQIKWFKWRENQNNLNHYKIMVANNSTIVLFSQSFCYYRHSFNLRNNYIFITNTFINLATHTYIVFALLYYVRIHLIIKCVCNYRSTDSSTKFFTIYDYSYDYHGFHFQIGLQTCMCSMMFVQEV